MDAAYTSVTHAPTHSLPSSMAPYTLPPSLSHSPKRRELVKDARRQHADRVVMQLERPGHETRRQSALTHSTSTCPPCPSACTCVCPMHMRHAHCRVHRASLSLSGYARTVHACAHVHVPLVMNTIYQCGIQVCTSMPISVTRTYRQTRTDIDAANTMA
jgi:hypothetical protein